MRYRFITLIILLHIILLSGCTNYKSRADNETETNINNLLNENERLVSENEELVNINNSLNTLIKDYHEKDELQQQKIASLEKENSNLNSIVDEKEVELSRSLQLVDKLEKDLTNSISQSQNIITLDELDVGSSFDQYTITNIISDEKHFSISLDGYFILEGDFMLNDGYGNERFYFLSSDYPGNNFCNTNIVLENNRVLELPNPIHVVNDNLVEKELGEELCEKFDRERDKGNWMRVHAVAVFSDYSSSMWWESEGMTTANLVKILEIEELNTNN